MKKIGILGSGAVAKSLGTGFLKLGHQVMLGTRDASKLAEWKTNNENNASVGSFEETAKFGDMLILAVSGKIAADVIETAGPQNFYHKTVIDPTNPISSDPPVDGVLKFLQVKSL